MAGDQPGFGALLRGYRMTAGLTQEALAVRAGLSLRGVSDLERGLRHVPYPDTVERLAVALGLGPAERAALWAARRPAPAAAHADASLLPRSALPVPLTSFIGRERELGEVRGLLGTARLVTLTGAGGVGKTRLAVAAAQQQSASFAQGVHFVALAGVGSASLLASAIAAALGVSFSGPTEPKLQLVRYLRDKHLLLVLDNFEHLLDGTDVLTDILSGAPAVTILVTSRERLNLQEEWVLLVEGLPFPERQATEAIDQYPAVQLFVQRARQVQAEFSLPEHAQPVIDLCQQVEGMPLALELAATWLRVMPCDQIALQIARSLDFLTTPVRNVPDRHRSLRAVFDRSWRLLSDAEQRVLARLSVFRGGFDGEAAEQVAGASLRVVAGLVDKSLIRVSSTGRYDLHELVRQYLAEKLGADGDASGLARRHFDFFARLVELAERQLYGPGQEAWYDRLEIESDNVSTALAWALREQQAEAGLRVASALGFFWMHRGHWHDGLDWLERLLEMESAAPAAVRAKALRFAGVLASADEVGGARARNYCEQSLALCRQAGDKRGVAWSLADLGVGAESRLDRAIEELEEALALFRELEDGWGISHALRRLGRKLMLGGEYGRATAFLEEALARAREVHDKNATAHALTSLGHIAWRETQDHARATALFQESLALSRVIREKDLQPHTLFGLAEVAEAQQDFARAQAYYEEVLLLFEELSADRGYFGLAHFRLGRVAQAQGHFELARHRFGEVLALLREQGPDHQVPWLAGYGFWGFGALANAVGDPLRAARLFGAAYEQFAGLDDYRHPLFTHDSFDGDMTNVRAKLGQAAFAEAFAEGGAMPMERAVAYAVGDRALTSAATPQPASRLPPTGCASRE